MQGVGNAIFTISDFLFYDLDAAEKSSGYGKPKIFCQAGASLFLIQKQAGLAFEFSFIPVRGQSCLLQLIPDAQFKDAGRAGKNTYKSSFRSKSCSVISYHCSFQK